MLEKIESIKRAYEEGNYIAALTLTLTLPDICAQVEYPEITYKKFGRGYVGERYKKWFNSHIKQYFGESGEMNVEEKNSKLKFLDGKTKYVFDAEACYALRCAVLHSGNDDIAEKISAYSFLVYAKESEKCLPISLSSVFSHCQQTGEIRQTILLDLDEFCYMVCKEAEESYESNQKAYLKHTLPIKFVPLNTFDDFAKILENIGPDSLGFDSSSTIR